jgi:hypothetical protein
MAHAFVSSFMFTEVITVKDKRAVGVLPALGTQKQSECQEASALPVLRTPWLERYCYKSLRIVRLMMRSHPVCASPSLSRYKPLAFNFLQFVTIV